jgi:hypothetical protein
MNTEIVKVLDYQLSHGLDFEKKYIDSTINKIFKVELYMLKREIKTVETKLSEFEKSYKMSSDSFYKKFNEGKLGDDRGYISWFAYKDTYNKLIERLKEIQSIVHA